MFNCWLFYPYTEISIEHRTNFPWSGHNLPTPEPSPHAPALVSTAALRRPTPTDSWLLGRILFRVSVRHRKSWPGKFDAENFPWNQFQPLLFFRSLFFFSLMLARWNLPLLLFVLCWLIGWLVAFYQRLKVDSFSHTRLASGFRAAVWTGERGRNWASAGKLAEGKLIEHETTFNFGPFFFCLRRGIVNTCWGLYLDSILFNSFEECLIFTAIDTHTSGIAIWHFGLTFFFLI